MYAVLYALTAYTRLLSVVDFWMKTMAVLPNNAVAAPMKTMPMS